MLVWLRGQLAAAGPDSVYFLRRGGASAAAETEQLGRQLLEGGCVCIVDEPDLLVYEYVGAIGAFSYQLL